MPLVIFEVATYRHLTPREELVDFRRSVPSVWPQRNNID